MTTHPAQSDDELDKPADPAHFEAELKEPTSQAYIDPTAMEDPNYNRSVDPENNGYSD